MDRFWNFVTTQDDEVELRIDGEIIPDECADLYEIFGIDAINPKSFTKELKKHDGKNITVWINSYGGSCVAASLIYTQLSTRKGTVTVKIDGAAISAASVIAMAGCKVLMSPTAIMMIHNPLTYAEGDHNDMQKAINTLAEVKESIINAYELKTKLDRKTLSKLMEEETWMSANKAIELGFADGMLERKEVDEGVMNKVKENAKFIYNCFARPQAVIDEKHKHANAVFEFIKNNI